MTNSNYTVREMVTDSVIATIICLYIIVLSYFNLIFSTLLLFLIPITIGLYFKDKTINRTIIFTTVILLFSLLFVIFYHVLLIIPNLILGVLIVMLLKVDNKRIFYTASIPIFYIIDTINDLFYARLILGVNFIDFLTEHIFISDIELINKYISLFIILYLFMNLIISIAKVIILRQSSIIYDYRIKPLFEEQQI